MDEEEQLLYNLCKIYYLFDDYLTEYLIKQLWKKFYKDIEAFHLIDKNSRRLLVIPDPCGLLKENEIFVYTSTGNSLQNYKIWTGPALIARNPSLESKDVQKVICRDIQFYKYYYKDIILVSTEVFYYI